MKTKVIFPDKKIDAAHGYNPYAGAEIDKQKELENGNLKEFKVTATVRIQETREAYYTCKTEQEAKDMFENEEVDIDEDIVFGSLIVEEK